MAIAASAFCTLWLPSIGRRNPGISRVRPRWRSVTITSKLVPFLSGTIRSTRTSACGLNP